MKAQSFLKENFALALMALAPMVAARDLDVRIPEGTDVAMLIDFDAIRRSGADVGSMASAAIDESVRIKAFRENTGNGMKDIGGVFAKSVEDAGMLPENFHWMLCGLRAVEYYVSDRQSVTQRVWSVAVAADGCDWERIGNVAEQAGLEWQKDTVFGHRVFNAVKKRGKMTRYCVRCVPGDDKMAYLGSGASKEWECYNTNVPQDVRFADMGHLADGEIVRISLVNDKPLSDIVRQLHYRALYPTGLEHIRDRIQYFRLSLFLDERSVSAELRLSCSDTTDAETLTKAYLAMTTKEYTAAISERLGQESGDRHGGLKAVLRRVNVSILENMEVSCNNNIVVVKTGKQDAQSALMVFLGSIGSIVDFFDSFFQ